MPKVQLDDLGRLVGVSEIVGGDLSGASDIFDFTYSFAEEGEFSIDPPARYKKSGHRVERPSGRSVVSRIPEILRVNTDFTIDTVGKKLEGSRRIKNISPAGIIQIHTFELSVDHRYSKFLYPSLLAYRKGYSSSIGISLNLNPASVLADPPDHEPEHCDPTMGACPLPSLTHAPSEASGEDSLIVHGSTTLSGNWFIYHWPAPVTLKAGRELQMRLTYFYA